MSDDDSDSDGYDINDPRTREHRAYKISQDNAGRATRRFRYGDDVDADGTDSDPDEEENHDPMERRLENAREARGWAFEQDSPSLVERVLRSIFIDRMLLNSEAERRYQWNARWTGGDHEGVVDEADKRMEDVDRWNERIAGLERQIDHAHDAQAHHHDSDSESDGNHDSSHSEEEYEKNVLDAREAREKRYDSDEQDDEQGEDASSDDEGSHDYSNTGYDSDE